jgi:hypothetical protein
MLFSFPHHKKLHKDIEIVGPFNRNLSNRFSGPTGQRGNGLNGFRGVALLEFAIFGSLFLMALSVLLQVGLQLNFQQEADQAAFRKALQLAKEEGELESQSTTYQITRHRVIPDPSQPFAIMPRGRVDGDATVVWGERLTHLSDEPESEPRTFIDLDGKVQMFRSSAMPEDKPLVGLIVTESASDAKSEVAGAGAGAAATATLASQTSDTVTWTLNTTTPTTLTSELSSGCNFSGSAADADWRCWSR